MNDMFKRMFLYVYKRLKKTLKNPQNERYINHHYVDKEVQIGFDLENEAISSIKIIRNNTMLPYVNLLTLFEQVAYCENKNIEGDFVECGVWKGGAIGLMALANLNYGTKKRNLHLFDVFSEICAPDINVDGTKAIAEVKNILGDKAKTNGELEPLKGIYDNYGGPGTLEENQKLLEEIINYPSENIFYHKGWFSETVPVDSKEIGKIAILRLDGDWYASTKICLDNLYDKVVDGGFIIVDDYGCYEGCRKAVDEFMLERNIQAFMNFSNRDCRYWIKH